MASNYDYEEIIGLCERMEKTYTPAVADSLDDMGFMNQCMHVGFSPIMPEASVAGPALPWKRPEQERA